MNKKVGIGLAVFLALLVICCTGIFFFFKTATGKIMETVSKDQVFVANVLKSTTKNWDENEFSKFADDSFNTPDKREETRKLFATLKKNLGALVELGEVTTGTKAFKANNEGNGQGFFVSLTAKAKFEKGNGVFTVVVKNFKEQMKITSISLDPDKPQAPGTKSP